MRFFEYHGTGRFPERLNSFLYNTGEKYKKRIQVLAIDIFLLEIEFVTKALVSENDLLALIQNNEIRAHREDNIVIHLP